MILNVSETEIVGYLNKNGLKFEFRQELGSKRMVPLTKTA